MVIIEMMCRSKIRTHEDYLYFVCCHNNIIACVCVSGWMIISKEMHEIFFIVLIKLCERKKQKNDECQRLNLIIHIHVFISTCLFLIHNFCLHTTVNKYRCDDVAVKRINTIKWCCKWIRWTCRCCVGIRSKGTIFRDVWFRSWQKIQCVPLQLYPTHTPNTIQIPKIKQFNRNVLTDLVSSNRKSGTFNVLKQFHYFFDFQT